MTAKIFRIKKDGSCRKSYTVIYRVELVKELEEEEMIEVIVRQSPWATEAVRFPNDKFAVEIYC